MKKLLIISYCFPPCNLTSSQRVLSWAKYLPEYGWHPIIVCRKWEKEIKVNSNQYVSTELKKVEHEINDGHEIYWLPYKANLRDRLLQNKKFFLIRKLLSFLYLFLEKPFCFFDSLGNYQTFVKDYLNKNKIDGLYITADPFVLLRIGHVMNKIYHVKWGADYRDPWTSSNLNYSSSYFGKLVRKFDSYFEKRWLKTTSFITAISPQYLEEIGKYLNKPGKVIYNGYFEQDFNETQNEPLFEKFTVTYLGSLYEEQQIEIFLSALKRLLRIKLENIKFQMFFPGLSYISGQKERVLKFVNGFEHFFQILDRVPRKEALRIQKKSHLLLHVGWPKQQGVVGSKIYEYMAAKRPILICPSDNGILKDKIIETQTGYIAQNELEAFEILLNLYEKFERKEEINSQANHERVKFYSRKIQTEILAEFLNKHFVSNNE